LTRKTLDPSEVDLLITQDSNGLNAGSFFIRNTALTRLILDFYLDPLLLDHADTHFPLRDQDLLVYLVFQHPELRKRVGWVRQNVFNAYPDGAAEEKYWSGDLVVHFVSCGCVAFVLWNVNG
jgi:galactosyl transferase GMA12/MNN10 family